MAGKEKSGDKFSPGQNSHDESSGQETSANVSLKPVCLLQ